MSVGSPFGSSQVEIECGDGCEGELVFSGYRAETPPSEWSASGADPGEGETFEDREPCDVCGREADEGDLEAALRVGKG